MDPGLIVFEAESMGFLVLSWALGIALHEAGHGLLAWWTGLQPRMVSVGTGRALMRRRVGAVWLIWRMWPSSGFVRLMAPAAGRRVARFAMVAAGPATNLVLLVPIVAVFWTLPEDFMADRPEAFMAMLCWMMAQGLIFLTAIVPRYGQIGGGRQANDGLKLWLLLTKPDQGTMPKIHAALLRPFLAPEASVPPMSDDSQAIAYEVTRLDRVRERWAACEAEAAMRAVLARDRMPGPEKALVLAFLVESALLWGETGTAEPILDAWSSEALELAPSPLTRLMRGGVLVALGRFEEGRAWVLGALKAGTVGALPVIGRAFLAQAAAGMGEAQLARQWMALARAKVPKDRAGTLMPVLARLEAGYRWGPRQSVSGAGISSREVRR